MQSGLWIVGFCAISYCVFVLGDGIITQAHLARTFERTRTANDPSAHFVAATKTAAPKAANARLTAGQAVPLGRLEIARIGVSAMIVDGADSKALRVGLGHIPGTATPDEGGNVAIAGHRDTFFRPLRRIRKGDDIVLETAGKDYHYRVSSTEIVDPSDVQVLTSHEQNELTLITCYPFFYVGRAPKRFIVHAVLAE